MSPSDPAQPLKNLQPSKEFFIGIDSDGCVFDTMEIKQKECFIPNIIKFFELQPVSKYVRETAEFVNLYSKSRGINRWIALLLTFDLLDDRPEVRARNVRAPEVPALRKWVETETKLANPALQAAVEKTGNPELAKALQWSETVNKTVAEFVRNIPPFPYVRESLEKITPLTDVIVCSATPNEALVREWVEHDLDKYPRVIAGQEMGTKAQHLAMAAKGKYPPEKTLMIGDAPGDRKAADANNVLFYPINPGHEDASWQRFHDEAFDRFMAGTYAGAYQDERNREFDSYLPETPPWKRQ